MNTLNSRFKVSANVILSSAFKNYEIRNVVKRASSNYKIRNVINPLQNVRKLKQSAADADATENPISDIYTKPFFFLTQKSMEYFNE